MIERYSGSARFEINNDGQWVSYGAHEKRMKEMLAALKLCLGKNMLALNQEERDQVENAFYNYCEEIPGMPLDESLHAALADAAPEPSE